MRSEQAIVIRNDFTNQSLLGHGSTLHRFIEQYAARPGAIQAIPGDQMANKWNQQIDRFYEVEQYRTGTEFADLADRYLKAEGISFDGQHFSLSEVELKNQAQAVQTAYEAGHSVMKLVISFDTDYLIDQNVLALPKVKNAAGQDVAQALPGGAFDLVDQVKLRYAVQRGMNQYVQQNGMAKPMWVGTLQFDRQHVHAHIACVDQGPLAQSQRRLRYQGSWQDRGKILSRGRQTIRQGIDTALTFTRGLHRSTMANQTAREVVNVKTNTLHFQQQYQQQLASQLLQLMRLRTQLSADNDDDLYWQKLGDYRDSLVMQEAQMFNLPAQLTPQLRTDLDRALDQQVQTLTAEGMPDQLRPAGKFSQSQLGQALQAQTLAQEDQLRQINHQVNAWQKLGHNYQKQWHAGQAGQGSHVMLQLYDQQLNRQLKAMTAVQAQNPLSLTGNYQHRGDLVNWRKDLLAQREALLETGYQQGWLISPTNAELKDLLNNPRFQNQLTQAWQNRQQDQQPWRKVAMTQDLNTIPAYQDLKLKATSATNMLGVDPTTVDLIADLPAMPQLMKAQLHGNALAESLKRALIDINDSKRTQYQPALRQFVGRWQDYRRQVIDYTVAGVQRGLVRPINWDQMSELLVPPTIGRPLDQRDAIDQAQWGYLTKAQNWTPHEQAQWQVELAQEQPVLARAQQYLTASGQHSLTVTASQAQYQKRVAQLPVNRRPTANKKPTNESAAETKTPTGSTMLELVRQTHQRQQQLAVVSQQMMADADAEAMVDHSRRVVHQVLTAELG